MGWSVRVPGGVQRLMPRLIHGSARFVRPLTMGVRAAVERDGPDGAEVFLVRHTYVAGWHLPGGAVEVGETAGEAVLREVREECAIAVEGPPELVGLYFNRRASRRDHVALYRVRRFRVEAPRRADWEIAEAGFFPRSRLPEGTTPATRARLGEIYDGREPTADW
ncbi:NUDIX domain-containing protein [Lichenibacterium minor]|uniref:NUDIX domain-containing protein n=1 Tax=Lichenibacterium minor TaxID=2316528 RepID=A0A4Q2U9B4_9HYPH|nr:NUDIX domain-containing protein [Lichenibacterium minor]RYC33383.1 NUDIX domain-containing protein [Lichenibacterium minor]